MRKFEYEALVLGGTGYAVFILDRSSWWLLLGVIVSASQLKPLHFNKEFYREYMKNEHEKETAKIQKG